jgi:hypothetical protein
VLALDPPTMLFFVIPWTRERGPDLDLPFFATVPELLYLCVVILVAIFITAAYANSRTMLARIAPPEMMTGSRIYSLSGTATTWLSAFSVSFFTTAFESQRAGFASILIFLGVGCSACCSSRKSERAPSERDSEGLRDEQQPSHVAVAHEAVPDEVEARAEKWLDCCQEPSRSANPGFVGSEVPNSVSPVQDRPRSSRRASSSRSRQETGSTDRFRRRRNRLPVASTRPGSSPKLPAKLEPLSRR